MKPITIVLTENYSDWEIATLGGVGRAFYSADIRFASPDGGALTSAAGLPVRDTTRFLAPKEGVVVLCGSSLYEAEAAANARVDLTDRLQEARKNGCVVAAICGGTIALARAGLLDDVKHTSNGPGYLNTHAKEYSGADLYVDQPQAIQDGDIITAPAPAPASFATLVLAAAGLDRQSAEGIRHMLAAELLT